jgi:hypothetical protein
MTALIQEMLISNTMPPIVAMAAMKYTLYTLEREGRPMVKDGSCLKKIWG